MICWENRIEIYAPQAEGIALADRARINSVIHEDDRSCFDFRTSQTCRDAIAGIFPNSAGAEERLFDLSEGIVLLQKQHNDLVQEANQAIYRVQQSWFMLSEAYAALVNGYSAASQSLVLPQASFCDTRPLSREGKATRKGATMISRQLPYGIESLPGSDRCT